MIAKKLKETENQNRMKYFNFQTKQKGYGRQGLYISFEGNLIYIMDVFPNINEYFGIKYKNDVYFYDEEDCYKDCDGVEIDEKYIYTDIDEWLSEYLQEEVIAAIKEWNKDDEE
ncbi:MAG: hypothetical protein LBR17_08500 [Bacteroidales bacterium]|jgi:hypothetical protein|nr:hypothetical protein [Bacteroidales bacterium]